MQIQEIQNKRIAFKALDWGLGHVTRSLSVLKQLLDQKNELFIFGTKKQIEVYSTYKIEAQFIELNEIDWNFLGSGKLFTEGFHVARAILKKKKQSYIELEDFLVTNEIDVIVSDHDYGFYSHAIPSIFMTHQLNLPDLTPWLAKKVHSSWMKSFAFVWIVDDEKKRLAGKLSEIKTVSKEQLKYQYIGLRSRYSFVEKNKSTEIPILLIISGPKPYSSQFLQLLLSEIKKTEIKVHVVCPNEIQIEDEQLIYPSSNEIADQWFLAAELIVSRCGYTTLMDCALLNKKGLFLATEGQLEQEYLASIIKTDKWNLYSESVLFAQKFNEYLSES